MGTRHNLEIPATSATKIATNTLNCSLSQSSRALTSSNFGMTFSVVSQAELEGRHSQAGAWERDIVECFGWIGQWFKWAFNINATLRSGAGSGEREEKRGE
ncbi:MAG: hypothetical protein U1D70_02255, partial [Methylobacter sp.]|nr:hypothetical protein [Methylobacter sp.]